ncbi:serine/threonine protein kinase [Candidatus Woesearchaeota archaeon]|jgi:serine/threonine protein kinase|nr:serine/threonine protein kinase [Candidatus Woesearchaeota archaeon]MBT5342262.1 serine/threonine protein kinase [Candidatus Woesearchaeota archaeon]
MKTNHPPQTGIGTLDDSSKTDYDIPNPQTLNGQEMFESVFGQCRDAGSFGAVTQSPEGGVRKVVAFSVQPSVKKLAGVHSNVKVDHLGGRDYSLQTDNLSENFTLSEPDHLHVVAGVMEGVILRSLRGVEGVVSYRDRKFTAVHGYVFMSTEMDEAPGKTADSLVKEECLTLESALNISYDTASTLQKVHNAHVIHGDITPKNIMSDGQKTTLTDFGNSRVIGLNKYLNLSFRGMNEMSFVVEFADALPKVGTPAYFAPETPFEGSSIAGDIYSMNTTALYLTTGLVIAPIIRKSGWSSKLYNLTKEEMIKNDVPEPVCQAILFNLAASPENRDLEFLISTLGDSLGVELPGGVKTYSCPSVFARTQLSRYSDYEAADTEFLSKKF